jgi:hypothetical protein
VKAARAQECDRTREFTVEEAAINMVRLLMCGPITAAMPRVFDGIDPSGIPASLARRDMQVAYL